MSTLQYVQQNLSVISTHLLVYKANTHSCRCVLRAQKTRFTIVYLSQAPSLDTTDTLFNKYDFDSHDWYNAYDLFY